MLLLMWQIISAHIIFDVMTRLRTNILTTLLFPLRIDCNYLKLYSFGKKMIFFIEMPCFQMSILWLLLSLFLNLTLKVYLENDTDTDTDELQILARIG